MEKNLTKEYGKWIGSMDWDYILTIRRNYKTNSKTVRTVSEKIFNRIPEIDKLMFIGERDKMDWNNHHIHLLINTNDKSNTMEELLKLKSTNKSDLIFIEEVENNIQVGMYVTKYIDKQLPWDILIK